MPHTARLLGLRCNPNTLIKIPGTPRCATAKPPHRAIGRIALPPHVGEVNAINSPQKASVETTNPTRAVGFRFVGTWASHVPELLLPASKCHASQTAVNQRDAQTSVFGVQGGLLGRAGVALSNDSLDCRSSGLGLRYRQIVQQRY